jgi:dolichyl-phosphate-mannose-protein mannosyltransferase
MNSTTVRMRLVGLARKQKDASSTNGANVSNKLDAVAKEHPAQNLAEWDYWLALLIITVLAFITRFWGISHPDEVAFDEVHVGKVRLYSSCRNPQKCSDAQGQPVCLILS